jgi:hypothetical protein
MTSPADQAGAGSPQAPQAPAPGQAQGQQAPSSDQGAGQQAPEGQGQQAPEGQTELDRLRAALAHERDARKAAQDELAQQRQAAMSDSDKALAKARDEGKAEARREAGLRLAAAEFRAAAAGKLADPDAALEVLDLAKFVNDDGEVDRAELAKLIERLVASLPAANGPGRVPAGPRGSTAADGDFLRQALGGRSVR